MIRLRRSGLIRLHDFDQVPFDVLDEGILIADLRARGETFEMPSDPLTDKAFIRLLNRVYDPGTPSLFPPEPEEVPLVA
jgi:hypothetical protein